MSSAAISPYVAPARYTRLDRAARPPAGRGSARPAASPARSAPRARRGGSRPSRSSRRMLTRYVRRVIDDARRLRVLISAYAFGPSDESEASAGWRFALAAAVDHDVWVLTRRRFRDG